MLQWALGVNRLLRRLIPRPSRDVWPESSQGGTKYTIRRQGGRGSSGGSAAETWPFQVYNSPYTGTGAGAAGSGLPRAGARGDGEYADPEPDR